MTDSDINRGRTTPARRRGVWKAALSVGVLAGAVVGVPATAGAQDTGNVAEVAASAGSFSTLLGALEATGLDDAVEAVDGVTVFAPTDEAFARALEDPAIAAAIEDPHVLGQVLVYHMVSGAQTAEDLSARHTWRSIQGENLTVDAAGGTVNDIPIVATDVTASNGVIHVIDGVLLPEGLLGGAPDEDGADEGSDDEAGDEETSDDAAESEAPGTIPEVAAAAGSFSTLLDLVTQAGLAETLTTGGPFTVFAPTDAAFEELLADPAIAEAVSDPEVLTRVLLYHVVEGAVTAADLQGVDSVTTLSGQELPVDVANLMVGGASIAAADVEASNGVIHVIDGVLVPELGGDDGTDDADEGTDDGAEGPNVAEVAAGAGSFTTLVGALEATGLDDAVAAVDGVTVFAPTDEAFARVLADPEIAALVEDPHVLGQVLVYHMVSGAQTAEDLSARHTWRSIQGQNLTVDVANGTVNGIPIVATDVTASNGVIHVIDGVLLPELGG
ncbi:MAG: fasciclin domain-containing protein [Actinomycetota bacterium]|nr:fasciclin domain-containing protein [Actinomycetota bacterium]